VHPQVNLLVVVFFIAKIHGRLVGNLVFLMFLLFVHITQGSLHASVALSGLPFIVTNCNKNTLIDWGLMPTLAVFQLYLGLNFFLI
jgi:hypothetical protein